MPISEYSETSAQSILLAQSGRTEDGSDLARIEDVGADGLARLISQYHGSPRLQRLILALVAPLQEAEDSAFQLLTEVWSLDLAEGVQLDLIGELVSESRDGRTDAVYRASLRVRVLVNDSNGTANELLAIAALYSPEGGQVRIEQYQPKAIVITMTTRPTDPSGLVRRLRRAKEAGASLDLVYPVASLAESFAFSPDYLTLGSSSSQGFGDTYGSPIGGALAHVL